MSREARDFVWAHSPFKGAAFIVHLVIAEKVNKNENDLYWLSLDKTAEAARISKRQAQTCLETLIAGGYLELVEGHRGGAGRGRTFRFLFAAYVEATSTNTVEATSTVGNTDGAAYVEATSEICGSLRESHLLIEPKEPSAAKTPKGRPHKEAAHALAVVAFEQTPKPVTRGGFAAVLKMIETTLEGGHSREDIEAAIRDGIGTWSLNGISFALTRLPRSTNVSYDAPETRYA